jgi:hypothetical protein
MADVLAPTTPMIAPQEDAADVLAPTAPVEATPAVAAPVSTAVTPESIAAKHGITIEDYQTLRKDYPEIATDEEFDAFLTPEVEIEQPVTPAPAPVEYKASRNKFAGQGISDQDYNTLVRDYRDVMTPDELDKMILDTFDRGAIDRLMPTDLKQPNIALPPAKKAQLEGDTTEYDDLPFTTIKLIAKEHSLDPRVQDGINQIYQIHQAKKFLENVENTKLDLEEIGDVDRPGLWFQSFYDDEAEAMRTSLRIRSEETIVKQANAAGVPLSYNAKEKIWQIPLPNSSVATNLLRTGDYKLTPDKQHIEVTPGVLKQMYSSKGEIAGTVAGVVGGTMLATQAAKALASSGALGFWGKLGVAAIPVVTTAIGTTVGDQADYLMARMNQHIEYDHSLAMEKAGGKLAASVMWDIGGFAAVKGGAAAFKASSEQLAALWVHMTGGNTEAAVKVLTKETGVAYDVAVARVQEMQDILGITFSGKTMDEKVVQMLATTENKSRSMLISAAQQDPSIITTMRNAAIDRAKGFMKSIDTFASKFSDESLADPKAVSGWYKSVFDTISNYETNVGKAYQGVKDTANKVAGDFTFDIDKVAVDPIKEAIEGIVGITRPAELAGKKISAIDLRTSLDPDILAANKSAVTQLVDLTNRHVNELKAKAAGITNSEPLTKLIDAAYSINPNRSMADLIDLRQTVNHLYRQLPSAEHNSAKALLAAKSKIDKVIVDTMKGKTGGEEWLTQWSNVRKDYSIMKEFLEINKANLTANKENIDILAKELVRSSRFSSGTYADFMTAVRKGVQKDHPEQADAIISRIELSMVNDTVQKYAAKEGVEVEGIAFPELGRELRSLNLESKEAMFLVETADKLGSFFKADVQMVGTNSPILGPSSGIATSLWGKAKQIMVNESFNKIREKLPFGKWKDIYATRDRLAQLMVDPLNADVSEKLIRDIGTADGKFRAMVGEYQKQFAMRKAAGEDFGELVPIYVRHGQTYIGHTASKGTASRAYNTGETIPRKMIATTKDYMRITGKSSASRGYVTNQDKQILLENHFLAIEYTDNQILKLY